VDNFKVIYKILKILEKAMDIDEFKTGLDLAMIAHGR